MYLLFAFSNKEIIQAISWTLLHSLWQGILLSLIAGCIMLFTKRANPLLRYNLLTATLAVFIIGVAATFVNQLVNTSQIEHALTLPVLQTSTVEASADYLMIKPEISVIDKLVDFLNANAVWVVLAWLLIIGYKFIRLGFGLYNMHQLKRRQVSYPGEYWNNKVTELCRQLQVNQKVQLLQSHIIRIPAVIGYLKPVILFPAAMLTAMPLHEVEAVLIHELGHIRRRDFLINMLQNIVEVIFFFNPSILWVSSLIKTERENCCDDIAVSNTANKQDYIKALVNFQQFSQPATEQFAIAFAGEKNHLLSRVKRIVYNKNKTLNNMEKKFLSASLILVSVCLFAFVSGKKEKSIVVQSDSVSAAELPTVIANSKNSKNEKAANYAITFAKEDTIPVYKISNKGNMTGVTHTSIDGKDYRIIIKNSIVTHMYIDGKEIPAEKIIDYKTILDKHYAQMRINQEKSLRDSEKVMRDSEKVMRDDEKVMRDSEKAMRDSEKTMRDSEKTMRDSEKTMRDSEKTMRDSEKTMRDSEKTMRDSEKTMRDSEKTMKDSEQFQKIKPTKPIKPIEPTTRRFGFATPVNAQFGFATPVAGHAATHMRSEKNSRSPISPISPTSPTVASPEHSNKMMNKIIDDLIANNIIKNHEELYSLQLNAKKLVVNDVVQPKEVLNKFKDKYELSRTVTLVYETR